jgi:hypothetical protein
VWQREEWGVDEVYINPNPDGLGVYGSRNFEQVNLHNALSNKNLFSERISQKTSWEYILLNTFE